MTMAARRSTPLETEDIAPQMCTVDLRLKILAKVPLFTGLSPEEVAEVNRLFQERGYLPSETIYLAGDPASRLYVVAAGKVKLLRHTVGGQDVLLDILTPSEFFGSLSALGDETYSDTAQAHTGCCALGIAADDFQTVLRRYPSVTLQVLAIVAARLHAAHEVVRQLSAHPVESRVASTLLKLAQKLGEEREDAILIQVPLSRQDLAEMTGTTTETVSRVMSQFRKAGLIRSGRQWVAIADPERLAALVADDTG
ncbi:MAG TPA: Crp/Fnr family transcriptional regulator [Chloroflexi bacterium]|nr:Crp/Fnr family transcriptional regulator [Chloroflexota bacterium]